MPLYVYQCKECGVTFDKMVRFSEADRSPLCPECGSPQTQKKITSFASHGAGSSSSSNNCGSGGRFS